MEEEVVVKEEVDDVEAEEVDRTSNSLIWISSLSGFLSWAMLGVALILVGMSVYASFASGAGLGMNLSTLYSVLNWLLLLFVGASIFLILQMVSKSVFVLMDLQDNTNHAVELLEAKTKE
jgi:hypothetical protein